MLNSNQVHLILKSWLYTNILIYKLCLYVCVKILPYELKRRICALSHDLCWYWCNLPGLWMTGFIKHNPYVALLEAQLKNSSYHHHIIGTHPVTCGYGLRASVSWYPLKMMVFLGMETFLAWPQFLSKSHGESPSNLVII